MEESDEYCLYCDNYFVIEVKMFKVVLFVESEDVWINNKFIKDERIKEIWKRIMFDLDEDVDKFG